jgi:TP901 family phage tail tape measure protein
MVDRTDKVTLTAQVAGYVAGMRTAQAETRATQTTIAKLAAQKEAMGQLGRAALGFGALLGAGVVLAVKSFADFDAKMSQVKTLSHATGDQMKELSTQALHAGQAIGISAEQSADAEIELVKAGISVKNIMGGALTGALQLAAAGQIDVADATEIATVAMTQFSLKGGDIPHVADLLAAGADKALGGVQDLGEALKSGGLVSAQFGVSLDETVGTLSAFANAGLIGETAGTDLRQMLLKLANPAHDAASTMKDLGLQVYGANGQFVGISSLAGQLHDKLSKLTPAQRNSALAIIFGSRAIAGANVLYAQGAKGITDWTTAVNDTGFAAQQARGKMDNLNGDMTKLGAAFNTDIIESGSGANGTLRGIVQTLTGVVTGIGNLPQPVLTAGLAVGALTAGVALLGGGALIIVPRIAAMKASMVELELTSGSLAKKIGKGGVVLAALGVLTAGFANTGSSAELSADGLAKVDDVAGDLSKSKLNELFKNAGTSLIDTTSKSDKFRESLDAIATGNFFSNESGVAKFVDGATLGMTHLSDVYKTNEAQFKELGMQLSNTAGSDFQKATDGFNQLVSAAGGGKEAIRELLQEMPDYKAKLIELASAQGVTLSQTQLFNLAQGKGKLAADLFAQAAVNTATGLAAVADKAVDASGDVSKLADAIKTFGSGTLDARAAARDFQQAIDDASASIKKNKRTLDIHTAAGRANQGTLDDLATKTLDYAASLATTENGEKKATQAIKTGRRALIDQLAQYGITGARAQKYADDLGLIPGNIKTVLNLDTTGATNGITSFINHNRNHQVAIRTVITTPDGVTHVSTRGATFAKGGYTGDHPKAQIAGLVHGREFVNNAESTARPSNRRALEYMNAGGDINSWASGYTAARWSSGQGSGAIDNRSLNIPVTISGAVIGGDDHVATVVRRAVKTAIKNGRMPSDWLGR